MTLPRPEALSNHETVEKPSYLEHGLACCRGCPRPSHGEESNAPKHGWRNRGPGMLSQERGVRRLSMKPAGPLARQDEARMMMQFVTHVLHHGHDGQLARGGRLSRFVTCCRPGPVRLTLRICVACWVGRRASTRIRSRGCTGPFTRIPNKRTSKTQICTTLGMEASAVITTISAGLTLASLSIQVQFPLPSSPRFLRLDLSIVSHASIGMHARSRDRGAQPACGPASATPLFQS